MTYVGKVKIELGKIFSIKLQMMERVDTLAADDRDFLEIMDSQF